MKQDNITDNRTKGIWDYGYGDNSKAFGIFTKKMLDEGLTESPICLISPIEKMNEVDKANAEFICTACNNYDRLFAALKEIAVSYPENNTPEQDKYLCQYLIGTAQKAIEPYNLDYLNPAQLAATIEGIENDLKPLNAALYFHKSLQKLRIMLDLEAYADCATILGQSIVTAIQNKVPPDEVIRYIKDEAGKNKIAMASVITPELTEMILNF